MLDIYTIAMHAEKRFKAEIKNATQAKNVDKARVERRINERYYSRLTKACLGISDSYSLTEKAYSMCVAVPELLFSKMYAIGWGKSRKFKNEPNSPKLLYSYVSP
jgi:hypothetical protein